MKPTECPLFKEMLNIQESSRALAISIRRLRRRMITCESCECYVDCQVMAEFSNAVQTAIQEISDEWNLGAKFQ